MKRRLRNVTVTMEEEVVTWARVEAARQKTSISGLLSEILKQRMLAQNDYARAMRRALARKPFLRTNGRYPTRDEVHGRDSLR
jgi:hypothetical protein